MHAYDLIFIGLASDVVGATILAKGFMFKEPLDMYFESMAIFGRNHHVLKSALLQRGEAVVGAAFMVIGFLLQIWGSLHGGIEATQPGSIENMPRAVGVLGAVGIAGWLCLRTAHGLAKRQFYLGMFRTNPLNPLPRQRDDESWLPRLSRLLELRRKRRESDDDFFVRLQERNEQLCRRYSKPIQSQAD